MRTTKVWYGERCAADGGRGQRGTAKAEKAVATHDESRGDGGRRCPSSTGLLRADTSTTMEASCRVWTSASARQDGTARHR